MTSACSPGNTEVTRREAAHQRAGGAAGEVPRPDKAVLPAQLGRCADWDLQTTEVLGATTQVLR